MWCVSSCSALSSLHPCLVVKSLGFHMRPEASVFNIIFALNSFLRLSSHFRLTTIQSMSVVYSPHVPVRVSGSFLQLIYLQRRKPWCLTFLQPRMGEWLQVSHHLGEPLPAATVTTSPMTAGVTPGKEGISSGTHCWTGHGSRSRSDSPPSAFPLEEREQWELLKSF